MSEITVAGLAMLGSSMVAAVVLTFIFRTNSVLRVSGWRAERLMLADKPADEVEPPVPAAAPIALAEFIAATEKGAGKAAARRPEAIAEPLAHGDFHHESFTRAVASR